MAASSTHPQRTAPADRAYVRLAACPHCAGRRRVLVELVGEIRGRCLDCGADLPGPLGTERHPHALIVGRAGQGVLVIVAE